MKFNIHPDSHFVLKHNLELYQLIKSESSYENFLILSTPFHLPNSVEDVFSQKLYYEEGNFLSDVLKNINDIREKKTKLIFFFVDWWGFCNNDEMSDKINGNIVSYDIYKWIYNHLKNFNLLDYATFVSSVSTYNTNMKESFPIIEYHEPFNRYFNLKDVMGNTNHDKFKNFLFTLNRRPRPHRLYGFYKLYKLGVLKDTKYTFHFYDEVMQTRQQKIDYLNHYLKIWGIENIDIGVLDCLNKPSLDDTYNVMKDIQYEVEAYKLNIESGDCFLEVVIEYNCSDTKVFLTEKIARSIVMRKPFILFGDKNSLSEIRKLGFKTFETIWDESYDTLPTAKERIDSAIDVISELYNSDWQDGYSQEMKDILDYNWNHYYGNYLLNESETIKRIFN